MYTPQLPSWALSLATKRMSVGASTVSSTASLSGCGVGTDLAEGTPTVETAVPHRINSCIVRSASLRAARRVAHPHRPPVPHRGTPAPTFAIRFLHRCSRRRRDPRVAYGLGRPPLCIPAVRNSLGVVRGRVDPEAAALSALTGSRRDTGVKGVALPAAIPGPWSQRRVVGR